MACIGIDTSFIVILQLLRAAGNIVLESSHMFHLKMTVVWYLLYRKHTQVACVSLLYVCPNNKPNHYPIQHIEVHSNG